MSKIQNIRALEQRINDIVEDYINEQYNEEDVLSISRHCGKIILIADSKEKITLSKSAEIHPLCELVRTDDDGMPEADIDKITQIANNWRFLT